ncbi:polymer-forming cytoskeletal protein [Polynucleobacter sp. MWH-UH35A]|uniref:bactofilin family protein n=1 Tax=Polynucleobacter sp. MWH-UH35A TaxID=1855619 RepID=UPI001BFD80AC|nr:polymer-forming cytoskeletal protein [Polynucleobacter sp. MWH-UH35A]QWD59779.1 polymer-forming cytoskeletal protein [Polynucleobacter sp. MWH-UH35A]
MFEFSKKGPMADSQLTYLTTIGSGSKVVGNFTHRGNMLLSGHLVGDIHQDENGPEAVNGYTAVIGKTGFLEGDIHSAHAIIIGRINGSVLAKGRVEVYPGAIVCGDITYSQINVHPDARVNGNLKCLLSDSLHTTTTPSDLEDLANNVVPLTKSESA